MDSGSTASSDDDELKSGSDETSGILMEDSDSASEQLSDISQEALEDRRAGMAPETSGRPAVTPGERMPLHLVHAQGSFYSAMTCMAAMFCLG